MKSTTRLRKLHLVDKDASLAKIDAEIGGYDDDVEYSAIRIGRSSTRTRSSDCGAPTPARSRSRADHAKVSGRRDQSRRDAPDGDGEG